MSLNRNVRLKINSALQISMTPCVEGLTFHACFLNLFSLGLLLILLRVDMLIAHLFCNWIHTRRPNVGLSLFLSEFVDSTGNTHSQTYTTEPNQVDRNAPNRHHHDSRTRAQSSNSPPQSE